MTPSPEDWPENKPLKSSGLDERAGIFVPSPDQDMFTPHPPSSLSTDLGHLHPIL